MFWIQYNLVLIVIDKSLGKILSTINFLKIIIFIIDKLVLINAGNASDVLKGYRYCKKKILFYLFSSSNPDKDQQA